MTNADSEKDTLGFYEQEARRYPKIHARPIQKYSAEFERSLIAPHILPGSLCLDVGCGEGRTTRSLATSAAATVVGLDFSIEMLRVARQYDHDGKIFYCAGDAMELPFAAETFDISLAITSLNNVPDISVSLSEMVRVLKPGGKLIVLVINKHELAAPFRYLYFLPFFLYRALRGGKRYHSVTYSRSELIDSLPRGLRIKQLHGMRMLPDLVPEWPFNFYGVFQLALSKLLNWLAPLDRRLCMHSVTGKFSRFHFLVAEKTSG